MQKNTHKKIPDLNQIEYVCVWMRMLLGRVRQVWLWDMMLRYLLVLKLKKFSQHCWLLINFNYDVSRELYYWWRKLFYWWIDLTTDEESLTTDEESFLQWFVMLNGEMSSSFTRMKFYLQMHDSLEIMSSVLRERFHMELYYTHMSWRYEKMKVIEINLTSSAKGNVTRK